MLIAKMKGKTDTTPANSEIKLKKICTKKCKSCKGKKCPNYFGSLYNRKAGYYGGVLHSKKIRFSEDISNQKQPMDKADWQLVGGLIAITILLTIFGGLLI